MSEAIIAPVHLLLPTAIRPNEKSREFIEKDRAIPAKEREMMAVDAQG